MTVEKLTPEMAHSLALKALNNPKFSYTYYDETGWYSSSPGKNEATQRAIWRAVEQINPDGHHPFKAEVAASNLTDGQGIIAIHPSAFDAYAVEYGELLLDLQEHRALSAEQQIIVRLAVQLLELSTEDPREADLCRQMLKTAVFLPFVD